MIWEAMFGVGTVVLFIALAWGAYRYYKRNRANDRVTDAATKALYEDPDHYPETRRELQKKVRPS